MLLDITELVKKHNLDLTNILHVGAHTAKEYDEYVRLGAKKIHWVEAHDKSYSLLKKRLLGPVNKVSCAVISDKDNEEVTFNVTNNLQSSSILNLGEHKELFPKIHFTDKIKKKTTTIDTLLQDTHLDENINLIVIDIQGAELLALKGAEKTLRNTDALMLEINTRKVYEDCCLVDEIDEYVKQFGFERVATGFYSDHPWGDALYIKK